MNKINKVYSHLTRPFFVWQVHNFSIGDFHVLFICLFIIYLKVPIFAAILVNVPGKLPFPQLLFPC